MLRQSLTILLLPFFLYFITSCHLESPEIAPLYKQHKFDTNVINRLPFYDSLAASILEKASFFQQHINEKDSYRSYKYMPLSDDGDVSKKLPREVAFKISQYYDKLGRNFIYGFDVFKDSTIKIYIRRSQSDDGIDILENLSYYPPGSSMQRRAFPVKDTMLNKRWQYWIFFYKSRLPF